MRINRFIARTGVTSRRKAEEIIKAGSVTLNGVVVTELATELDPERDKVCVSGEEVFLPALKYYLLNKPKGYVTTKADPHVEKSVFELLPKDEALFAIGRLDKDTEGLLLFTNDGDFSQNIIHPSQKIEKEYFVKTKKPITHVQVQKLEEGVTLDDGPAIATRTERVGDKSLKVVITEGRNRQVRRMIEAINNEVTELKRIRIGHIFLDVEIGMYRALRNEEIEEYV